MAIGDVLLRLHLVETELSSFFCSMYNSWFSFDSQTSAATGDHADRMSSKSDSTSGHDTNFDVNSMNSIESYDNEFNGECDEEPQFTYEDQISQRIIE